MKFGIGFANTGEFATPEGAAELGAQAEQVGFDSIWTVEHVLWPEGYESEYPYNPSGKMPGSSHSVMPDPLVWLAYVGAKTNTIKLGTGIVILPLRNPAVLAKEAATADFLSNGRVILGVGVGWLEEEFDALGVPFRGRGRRTDEYIDIMRTLWSEGGSTYDGDFMQFSDVHSNPKPVNGAIPIHIGGHSRKAAERAGRIGDGFFPASGNIPELVDMMRQAATDAGRDVGAIEVTAPHLGMFGDDAKGAIEELASWGVQRAPVPAFLLAGDVAENCAMWAEKLGINPS